MKLLSVMPAKTDMVGVFGDDEDDTVYLCPVDAYGLYEIYSDGFTSTEAYAMYVDSDGKLTRFDEFSNFLGIVDRDEVALSNGKISACPEWLRDIASQYFSENRKSMEMMS